MEETKFNKQFLQTIYEEASKRLRWGSCVNTVIAVLERLGFFSEWMKVYRSNVDKITQEFKRLATEKVGNMSVEILKDDKAAQIAANESDGAYVVIATLVRYDDQVNKKKGNHHMAFILPSEKLHYFPKIGGGGVKDKRYILSNARYHFWYKPINRDYMTYVKYGK